MLRGLWKLTWLEIKIFLREPLGAIGTIVFPVLLFALAGRFVGVRLPPNSPAAGFISVGLPVLASILIALSGL
jgi:ABC-2 type transport system permease protein